MSSSKLRKEIRRMPVGELAEVFDLIVEFFKDSIVREPFNVLLARSGIPISQLNSLRSKGGVKIEKTSLMNFRKALHGLAVIDSERREALHILRDPKSRAVHKE